MNRHISVQCIIGFLSIIAPASAAGLNDVAVIRDMTSHRASSYDRSGGNEDSLVSFAPGTTEVLLDVDGPGRITHLWFTAARFPGHEYLLRDMVLRVFWENSPVPSVEVPLGDFFGLGHGKLYAYQSLPLAVGANPCAMNCYWPMPFYRHARIELANVGNRSIRRLYYNLDYELGPITPGQGLFHALYRREKSLTAQSYEHNTTGKDNYVILDAEGRGQYVGCTLSVDAEPGGWWGEGDDMIFIDRAETPTIIGTGSEDYFCNAWGYREPFSYPFYGAPLLETRPDGGKYATVYRWHIPDPVHFKTRIRVTIEHLFDAKIANDYTSVAYWYQAEPMRSRPALPAAADNQPLVHTPVVDIDASEYEDDLLARGMKARSITANLDQGYTLGSWLRIEEVSSPIELAIPVAQGAAYCVQVKPVNHVLTGRLKFTIIGGPSAVYEPMPVSGDPPSETQTPFVNLGVVQTTSQVLTLRIEGGPTIGLDHIRLARPSSCPAP